MICPNCGRKNNTPFCIHCGYMPNGNYVKYKNGHKTDLELFLGADYNKIVRNENYLLSFFLGPLYFCYKNKFFLGFILSAIDLLVIYFLGSFIIPLFANITIPFINIPILIILFIVIINRIIYMSFNNLIYTSLMLKTIKKYKTKYPNNYYDVYLSKKHNDNTFLPFLVIVIYLAIFFIYLLIK